MGSVIIFLDTLRAGGRRETGGLVGEDVYLKLNGVWSAMPKNECEAKSKGFTKQACYKIMGISKIFLIGFFTNIKFIVISKG